MPAPELTLVFALVVGLVIHACVLHRHVRKQSANLARLNEVLTRTTREHLAVEAETARAQRESRALSARLDALECRAAGGQRIESAMRVARQGAASPAVLKDLGLSEAEASLLLRLHSLQREQPGVEVPSVAPAASAPLPGQAASLAKLLAGVSAV